MPNLSTLADRVWYAIHCLPRDADTKKPPSWRSLEVENGIALATISKIVRGTASKHQHTTVVLLAKALRVTPDWLYNGGDDDAPTPTGMVPPREVAKSDGTLDWGRHGDLPGWDAAVEEARASKPEHPIGAYRAGADTPVIRRIDSASAEVAYMISGYAWATSTRAERRKFATLEAQSQRPSGRQRAAKLHKSPRAGAKPT